MDGLDNLLHSDSPQTNMALALMLDLANIGSSIVDLAAVGLSLKENNTSKIKTRLIESEEVMNAYFSVMNEKEG